MKHLLHLASILVCSVVLLASPQPAAAADDKAILITGASTGIGRHLAETLASKGYHVYAGARKDEDLAALNAIDNVTAVRLDVTRQDQIDAAVDIAWSRLMPNALERPRLVIKKEDKRIVFRVEGYSLEQVLAPVGGTAAFELSAERE